MDCRGQREKIDENNSFFPLKNYDISLMVAHIGCLQGRTEGSAKWGDLLARHPLEKRTTKKIPKKY